MNPSENRRWALVGPLTVALWVVGIILLNHNGPADHSTGSEILAWYKSDANTIILGAWLFMLGCLGFVTFVSGLRMRLAEAAGPASHLPGLALAGAAMAGSVDLFFVGAELAAILPLAAFAIVAWRTRVVPRWWASFSALVAIVLIVGPVGWLGLIFGTPIWLLGTSLFVLLGSRDRVRATAATA